MTLASASLVPTAAREQGEEEEEEALPHLIVLVDLQKCKERNRLLPCSALIDWGTTYNFVSRAVADSVRMRPAKARRRKNAIAKPPAITTVIGELQHTIAILWDMMHMHNSADVKRCHAINFVVHDIASCNIILEMAWLQ